jgi:hypothetical protein
MELRKLAAQKMANEAPGQTLQPTALVHEAWLRLAGSNRQQWRGRSHFFGAAAEAMRRILIDKARRKGSLKRGQDQPLEELLHRQNFILGNGQLDPGFVQRERPVTQPGALHLIRQQDLLNLDLPAPDLPLYESEQGGMVSVHNYIHSEMKKGAKELMASGPSTKSSDAGSFYGNDGNDKTDVKNETNPPADELPLSSSGDDEKLIQQCVEIIRREQKASISLIQRRLRLGFSSAGRIMDELERRGFVGPSKGTEPRDILVAGKSANRQQIKPPTQEELREQRRLEREMDFEFNPGKFYRDYQDECDANDGPPDPPEELGIAKEPFCYLDDEGLPVSGARNNRGDRKPECTAI